MTDLTAITTPFGLLDRETQETLRAHGGPYQWFTPYGGWCDAADPAWVPGSAYRVKAAPPKPREWWCVGRHMHDTEGEAMAFIDGLNAAHPEMDFGPIIHVREVLP